MDKKAISDRLRALATGDEKRSKAARLKDVFDDVERALAAGVSREDIRKELADHGLAMSFSNFETTLKRLRAKHRRSGAPSSTNSTTPHCHTNAPAGTHQASHNPADLDCIIHSKPDLAELAKVAKKRRTK